MNVNLVNKKVLNGLKYTGPTLRRNSKLLQGQEDSGVFSGVFSDIFKTSEGESNFTVDMVIPNETLFKVGALVALAIILNKKI